MQGGKHPDRAHQRAAADVGDLHPRHHRVSVARTDDAEHAGVAQIVEVVPGAILVRSILTVAGDRAIDEPRVLLREPLVPDPEPVHHARAERLDEDVGVASEAQQDLGAARVFQVEGHRSLAAVERDMTRAHPSLERVHPPDVIALARLLDLEHVRTHVGEKHGREAPGKEPREIEDLQALERSAHPSSSIATRGSCSI